MPKKAKARQAESYSITKLKNYVKLHTILLNPVESANSDQRKSMHHVMLITKNGKISGTL